MASGIKDNGLKSENITHLLAQTRVVQKLNLWSMKYFVGVSILALLAGIRADDFQDLFLNQVASDEVTNRHPLVVSNSTTEPLWSGDSRKKKIHIKVDLSYMQYLLATC